MFERLLAAAASDPRWDCTRQAVGSEPGSLTLHIAGNDGFSSSLRPMTEAHEQGEPSSVYVDSEEVEVTTLNSTVADLAAERIFLKVDVQGHEAAALGGSNGRSTALPVGRARAGPGRAGIRARRCLRIWSTSYNATDS